MPQGDYKRCKVVGCRKGARRLLLSTEHCFDHYETHVADTMKRQNREPEWVCKTCNLTGNQMWNGNCYCELHYYEAVSLSRKTPPDPLTDYTKVQPSPEPNYYLKQLIREVIAEELDKISVQKVDSNVDLIVDAIRSAMKGNHVS